MAGESKYNGKFGGHVMDGENEHDDEFRRHSVTLGEDGFNNSTIPIAGTG